MFTYKIIVVKESIQEAEEIRNLIAKARFSGKRYETFHVLSLLKWICVFYETALRRIPWGCFDICVKKIVNKLCIITIE